MSLALRTMCGLCATSLFLVLGVSAAATAPSGAAQLFIAPGGSDAARCSHTAPCGSLARAYALARPGDVVEIAAGQYGDQELSSSTTRSGKRVVFRPAAGAAVTLGGVLLDKASGVEIRGVTMTDWYMRYSSNVVIRNVTTRFFFIRSSAHISVVGGRVGGVQDGTSPTIGNYAGEVLSTDITVEGVFFHDIGRQEAPGAHVECLFLQEASRVVIRNSKFTRCDIMDLYVSPTQGGPTASNVLVENNWFDSPTDGGYHALNIHPDDGTVPHNFTVRFNSFYGTVYIYPGFQYDNVVVASNIGRITHCETPGVTYRSNVWTNLKCGSSDRIGPFRFVDAAHFDLHLAATSPALGAGGRAARPPTDIDGDRRPARLPPDAGADQRDPASIVAGASIGRVRLGQSQTDVDAFYGSPKRTTTAGGRNSRFYRVRGGTLWTTSVGGRIVGVGTTSPYYATPTGLSVGAPLPHAISRVGGPCAKTFRARLAGRSLFLAPRQSRGKVEIARIWLGVTPSC